MNKILLLTLILSAISSIMAGDFKSYQESNPSNGNGNDITSSASSANYGDEGQNTEVIASVDVTPITEQEGVVAPETEAEEETVAVEVSVAITPITEQEGVIAPETEAESTTEVDIPVEVYVPQITEQEEEAAPEEAEEITTTNNNSNNNDWKELSSNECETPYVKSLVNYGSEWIANKASTNGNYPSGYSWSVQQVHNVWTKVSGGSTHYNFNVTIYIKGSNKDYVILASFKIECKSENNKHLYSWKYHLESVRNDNNNSSNNSSNNNNDWKELSSNECETPYVKSLVNYGSEWIANKASTNGNYPSGYSWSVQQVHNVWTMVSGGSTHYKFNVTIYIKGSNKDYVILASFKIECKSENNKHLYSWKYNLNSVKKDTNNGSNNNTDNADWKELPSNECETPYVKSLVNYGSEWIANKASTNGNYPSGYSWSVQQVHNVWTMVSGDSTHYKFNVTIYIKGSNKDYVILASFKIKCKSETDKHLYSWKYNLESVRNDNNNSSNNSTNNNTNNDWKELPSNESETPYVKNLVNYGSEWIANKASTNGNYPSGYSWSVQQVHNVWTMVSGGSTNYNFNVTIFVKGSNKDYVILASFKIECKSETDKHLYSWKYNLTSVKKDTNNNSNNNTNNNNTNNDWTVVPAQECDSPFVKGLLKYGSDWVVDKASSKGRFSSTNSWSVKNVNNVWKKVSGKDTYYKFDVLIKVQDSKKSYALASTFEVRSRNGDKNVGLWKYNVSPWKN